MNTDRFLMWLGQNQVRLRKAACVLLALLCVYYLGLLVKSLVSPSPVVAANLTIQPPAQAAARWDWYANVRVADTAPEETADTLAIANIDAELIGVVIAGEASVASISVGREGVFVYSEGDEIQNNVSLVSVEADRVVISESGVRRQIPLKDLTGNTGKDQSETLIRVNETPANAGSGFTLPGVGSTLPINVPGVGMGLRVSEVSSDIADLADLNDGDVVLDINGTAVSDLFTNPLLWQQFSQQTSLPMTILRDGEQQEIFVNAASLFERIIPQLDAGLIQ